MQVINFFLGLAAATLVAGLATAPSGDCNFSNPKFNPKEYCISYCAGNLHTTQQFCLDSDCIKKTTSEGVSSTCNCICIPPLA
ncbi:hypothetical protein MPH_01255 [Macrophomina phaseolina MS6]|uniref:Uncharacterized protein n=2 Tax=Macrophomina phaseolina TaxID=35725 RepID=K2RFU0_MACPH|nr:hypothetical protein MPH_01255 [Macrophomina phaseolina MS6]KAH7043867.1 hypothetical protein B0J12DRAFT_742775 [Macrophomina phaseolina]